MQHKKEEAKAALLRDKQGRSSRSRPRAGLKFFILCKVVSNGHKILLPWSRVLDEPDIAFYTKHIINFSSPAIWYAIGTTILRLRPRRTATRDPRWQLFIPFPVLPVLPLLRACGHAEPQVKSVEAIIFLTSAGPSAITYLARTRTAIRRMVRSVPEE